MSSLHIGPGSPQVVESRARMPPSRSVRVTTELSTGLFGTLFLNVVYEALLLGLKLPDLGPKSKSCRNPVDSFCKLTPSTIQ